MHDPSLSLWLADSENPLLDVTVGDLVAQAALDRPDGVALIEGCSVTGDRRRWTFADLDGAGRRIATRLASEFEPGTRLAIWASNVPEWQLLQVGAAMAGLIVVTVNPAYTARELAFALRKSRVAGIIFEPEVRGEDQRAKLDSAREGCPELRSAYTIDEFFRDLDAAGDQVDKELPHVDPGDPAMILYTSGTTGSPKGAVLSHRGMINNASFFAERFELGPGSVWLTVLPMFHLSGCGFGALGALTRRATHVIANFEPGLLLRLIEEEGVAFLPMVPTVAHALLTHADLDSTDLSSLTMTVSGGTTVPATLAEQIEARLGADFGAIYGQTECAGVICQSFLSDSIVEKTQRVGRPLTRTDVKVIDVATGDLSPSMEVGEICVRSPFLMIGYFDEPDATKKTIDEDGWLHTGDLGLMDGGGYVQVTGRMKDMIIRGGQNVYAREVEDLLFSHERVGQVAVLGVPDEYWGEEVAAFVLPADDGELDVEEVSAWLDERLAAYKRPRYWLQVSELPATASGKIQKFALREGFDQGRYKVLKSPSDRASSR